MTGCGNQRVLAVIPARYASTRFPGKPLAMICGRPMIQWTYEQAAAAERVDEVVVATDDARIYSCVIAFGGRAVMTAADHPTGTDRIAEAVRDTDAGLILNVQGDEPLVPPQVLDQLVQAMLERPDAGMGTVAVPIPEDSPAFKNPNVVKCVLAADGYACYFSRAPVPHARDLRPPDAPPLQHWGIYAFRRTFLETFVTWPRSPLERCENLEQLRALEHGTRIYVLLAAEHTIGVDLPDDISAVEEQIQRKGIA